MAVSQFSYFLLELLFLTLIKDTSTFSVHVTIPEIKEDNFDMKSHLKYEAVWEYCAHRDNACKSNNTNICAMKRVGNKNSYKDFINGCYLFLSNMCDHPEDEYHIVTGRSCEEYLNSNSRRSNKVSNTKSASANKNKNNKNATKEGNSTKKEHTDARPLRAAEGFSSIYEVEVSYDEHYCPLSCPNVYAPVCLNINRGYGKFFKMMSFTNHCESDLYYCQNPTEFAPPPHEEESVISSPLSWSYCSAYRYLQFARFSEYVSAMGHYGWLVGDQKFTRILPQNERIVH